MTNIDLGRPVQGDVVELILDDHRRFEALLRDLRELTPDAPDYERTLDAVLSTVNGIAAGMKTTG